MPGHQTCQGGDLQRGAPTDKVTWSFDHVVLRDHVTNQKHLHYQSVGGQQIW